MPNTYDIQAFSGGVVVNEASQAVLVNLMQPHCLACRLSASDDTRTISAIVSVHLTNLPHDDVDPATTDALGAIMCQLVNSSEVRAQLDALLASAPSDTPTT
jgi:hypothetical protein